MIFSMTRSKAAEPVTLRLKDVMDLTDRTPVPSSYRQLPPKEKLQAANRIPENKRPYDDVTIEEMIPTFLTTLRRSSDKNRQEIIYEILYKYLEMTRLEDQNLLSHSSLTRIHGGLANELLLLGLTREDLKPISKQIFRGDQTARMDSSERRHLISLLASADAVLQNKGSGVYNIESGLKSVHHVVHQSYNTHSKVNFNSDHTLIHGGILV